MQAVVTTKLVEARVYRTGATLTSVGEAALDVGSNLVYVAGIPDDVIKDSVRVKFPQAVDHGAVRFVDARSAGLFEEERSQHDLVQRQIDRLEKRIANRKAERELWIGNADFTSGQGTTMAERIDYLSQLADRLDALDTELAELEEERDELSEKLEAMSSANGNADGKARGEVLLLEVEAREAGSCRFEVSYRIASAGWNPLYEIHVSKVGGPVTLRLRAEVSQRCGQDWDGVRLLLSSGNAQSSFSVPALHRLYVDLYNPETAPAAAGGRFAMPMGASAIADGEADLFLDEDGPSAGPEPLYEMAAPSVQASRQEIVSTYELSGTWSIASGSEGRIVDISTDEVSADFHLAAVPCEDDSVYLTAVLHGLEKIDLFDCDASVYLEGTFMGTTSMAPDPSTGDQVVPLGIDERIRITRKRVRHFTTTPALLGKRKLESSYEIRVNNLRPAEARVIVRDRIPVSKNKDVEVVAQEVCGGTLDEATGALCWEVELASGQEKLIEFGYAVSYPKNASIHERLGEATSAVASLSVEPRDGAQRFCATCGALVEDGLRFCPTCGAAV